MAIKKNKPLLLNIQRIKFSAAMHHIMLIEDALADVHKGVCTPLKALESLSEITVEAFNCASADYGTLKSMSADDLTKDYADMIHEVINETM